MYTLSALASLALLGLASGTEINFGPAFSLGPTNSWIREARTTLVLPEAPSPQVDRLALWPGMGTSGGDLIQALAVSLGDPAANCGASAGQWCTWASTLQGTQLGGKEVPASAGDELVMHYKYNDSTGKYDQTVTRDGKQLSHLSTSSGHAQGWGTAVECQESSCQGQTAAHKYKSTTIILDSADPSFSDTLSKNKVDASEFTTTDGGKTWKVETINVHAYSFGS